MQSYITRRYISLLITTHTNTLTVTCRYKACTHFSYAVIYPLYTHTRTYKTNSVHKYVCVCVRCSKDSVGGLSTAWMKVLCGGQRERTEKTLDWGQGLWVTSLHWSHVRRTGQWMKFVFVTSRCDYRKVHPSTEAPSGLSWQSTRPESSSGCPGSQPCSSPCQPSSSTAWSNRRTSISAGSTFPYSGTGR